MVTGTTAVFGDTSLAPASQHTMALRERFITFTAPVLNPYAKQPTYVTLPAEVTATTEIGMLTARQAVRTPTVAYKVRKRRHRAITQALESGAAQASMIVALEPAGVLKDADGCGTDMDLDMHVQHVHVTCACTCHMW